MAEEDTRHKDSRSGRRGARLTGLLEIAAVQTVMNGIGAVEGVSPSRIRVVLPRENVRVGIIKAQAGLSCERLIQISALDTGNVFELIYHMTGTHRYCYIARYSLPRDSPEIASVHDLLPPAGIYERQIHDLLGIVFLGHPGLKRLILNEDWPENEFPLRKDWKPNPGTFYGGIRPEGE